MWSETNQQLTQLAADLLGPEALTAGTTAGAYELLRARGNSIEGGTTEILKNIVAERVLGLPEGPLGEATWTSTSPTTSRRSSASRTSCSPRARRSREVREAAEAGAYDDALWRELRELGWPGIAVAEEHGGQGLGAVELAVLLEELGYACAATPFLSTARRAAAVIQHGGHRRAARALAARAGLGRADRAAIGDARELVGRRRRRAVVIVLDADGAAR